MTATATDTLHAELELRSGTAGHLLNPSDLVRLRATLDAVPPDARTVLDAGCGVGLLTDALMRSGHEATGIDTDDTAMAHMRAPHETASVAAIPFADRSFDVVVLNEVLEHLPVGVFAAARDEVSRVASKTVIVTVPNAESLESASTRCPTCRCTYSIHGHVRRFDRGDLDGLIPGFSLSRVSTVGPFKVRHRSIEWYVRRRMLDRWPAAPGTVCPQCSAIQIGQARTTEYGAASRARRILRAVLGFPWPRWWFIATYDREP